MMVDDDITASLKESKGEGEALMSEKPRGRHCIKP
jgi:hypothetical protein